MRVLLSFRTFLLLFAIVFLSLPLCADPSEDAGDYTYLDWHFSLDFKAKAAWFLVEESDDSLQLLAAELLEIKDQKNNAAPLQNWMAAALYPNAVQLKPHKFSLLVEGQTPDQIALFPDLALKQRLDQVLPRTIPALREYLLQRKQVAESWNMQVLAQDKTLRRLRDDADAIGNISRIVDAKDELTRQEDSYKNLDKDLENLRQFLSLAHLRSQPRNYIRREAELTKQIAKLNTILRATENSPEVNASQAHNELKEKLKIVESTRYDDIDVLQRELLALRKQRAQLQHGAQD